MSEQLKKEEIERPKKPGRFDFVGFDLQSKRLQGCFKDMFEMIESFIEDSVTPSRNTSRALTHLEDSYTAICKSIRDDQLSERGADLQEGRCSS